MVFFFMFMCQSLFDMDQFIEGGMVVGKQTGSHSLVVGVEAEDS